MYGLVIGRHNEIQDKLLYLSQHAFTSAYVCSEPLIHQDHIRSKKEICQGSDKDKEKRGHFIVKGLCDNQVGVIIDVKIGDANIDLYKYEPIPALLARWENIDKDKHSKHCHNERKQCLLCLSLSIFSHI